jgi:hypothetical protein
LKLNFSSNMYFFTISVVSELMVIATSKYIWEVLPRRSFYVMTQ